MEVFFSIILGAFIGYFIIKRNMEKRLFMILTKSGLFTEEQLGVLMHYYRDYSKICKEVDKRQRDTALKMECAYRLNVDDKQKKL